MRDLSCPWISTTREVNLNACDQWLGNGHGQSSMTTGLRRAGMLCEHAPKRALPNHARLPIIAQSPCTWVTLNNRLVVEGAVMENYWDRSQPLPAKGPIMLQTHGGEIRWRNIFVREIGAAEATIACAEEMLPNPTYYDAAYGPHPKQVLHLWKAESEEPTPLLLFIHGGGWNVGGRLSGLSGMLPAMLKEGISVASVEYRFIAEATADGVTPPVKAPLHDAARATVRTQQSNRVEYRPTTHRRKRWLRRCMFGAVACLSSRPRRSIEQRSGRPRIDST